MDVNVCMFHAPSITLNTFSSKSYLLVSLYGFVELFEHECVFFPSLVRLTSCLLSDLTSDRASCRSAESLDLWPRCSGPQFDSMCWISIWKRLSGGVTDYKKTPSKQNLLLPPHLTRSPPSPEDLLRKPIFLLFADFRGFGLRRWVALEQRFLHACSLKHNKRGAGTCGSLSLALMQKADVDSCGAEHESRVWLQTDGCESSLQGRRWKLNVLTLELQEVLHVCSWERPHECLRNRWDRRKLNRSESTCRGGEMMYCWYLRMLLHWSKTQIMVCVCVCIFNRSAERYYFIQIIIYLFSRI